MPAALPSLATSSIGSLPHTQLELALQQALLLDIPAAPQLPRRDPAEYMVPQALDGLPGLRTEPDGSAFVDASEWMRGAPIFDARLERTLEQGQGRDSFLPTPASWQALRPFLWEVEQRKLPFAKVQIAGPLTLRWFLRLTDGAPLHASPNAQAIEAQIVRLVLARALSMAGKVKDAGATPIVFLDEPGLYAFDRRDPRHIVALQELKVLVLALQQEGALTGIHCCGNTDWAAVLGLGLDIVSLDARLSLTSLLATGAFAQFHDGGGTLALGIVPTDFSATDDVGELVALVQALLPEEPLERAMLTPACGLALRSVQDAEHIFDELRVAQRRLTG
ncbi:MAG: hypothetical protein ACJ784_20825 [Myxococcales bacterium]